MVHLGPQLLISPVHSYVHVYRELEQAIRGADAQDDLRWFRSTSGPGMPMNWPQFEVRRCGDGEGKTEKAGRDLRGQPPCLTAPLVPTRSGTQTSLTPPPRKKSNPRRQRG